MPGWERLKGDGVQVVAMCDVVRKVAQQAADKFSVPHVYTDYRKMLRELELDIVDVCTPNKYHKAPTVAALQKGCHVLVEKPMAMTVAEAKAMIAAAKKARRKLMVGQNVRYGSESQAMKKFVDDGGLGQVYWAKASALRRRGIPGWGVFTNKELQGGGPIIDIGVHILDLTLWLMGFPEPAAVSGVTYAKIGTRKGVGGMGQWDWRHYSVEDHAAGLIRMRNGATIFLEASFALNVPQDEFRTYVCGTKGGICSSPLTFVTEAHENIINGTPQFLGSVQSHAEEIRLFVEAIRKNLPSPVPGEQALITQKILNGIYESAAQGKEVQIR
jgi:predicted dehydrogenase